MLFVVYLLVYICLLKYSYKVNINLIINKMRAKELPQNVSLLYNAIIAFIQNSKT